jgi:hypothetical protein
MLFTRQTAGGRCPCGAAHAACGPPSDVVPVDKRMEVAVVGGPLKKYRVTSASGAESVIKYNASDAERNGLTDADLVPERETVRDVALPDDAPQAKARSGSRNKARTAAKTKAADGGGA